MESTRQNKVARLIQKDLGEIFQQLGKSALQGRMVTVTVVRMSPDLSPAKVSPFYSGYCWGESAETQAVDSQKDY